MHSEKKKFKHLDGGPDTHLLSTSSKPGLLHVCMVCNKNVIPIGQNGAV
jgi:hypothetical protein